jgi:DNA-binding NarL/FixJ family response regulator
MPDTIRVKSYSYHLSISAMEEQGLEIGDNEQEVSNFYGQHEAARLLACLTKRQRQVAGLLNEGYSRKDTAQKLGISLQAIHQIVPRMRKRLVTRAEVRRI